MNSLSNFLTGLLLILLLQPTYRSYGQYLSNLNASKNDPLFSTYTAPMERSEYKLDQAYRMMWYDGRRNIEFVSEDGGNLGMAFKYNNKTRSLLDEYFRQPIVTASYPDIVKFYYYPFEHIRVEAAFAVYSSTQALLDYQIVNEGRHTAFISVMPYFYLKEPAKNILAKDSAFFFDFSKERDGWMKNHEIPYIEKLIGSFVVSPQPDRHSTHFETPNWSDMPKKSLTTDKARYFVFGNNLKVDPGDSFSLRIVHALDKRDSNHEKLLNKAQKTFSVEIHDLISANEKLFSKIPEIHFKNPDHEAIYWNAFNLIRQCMMPPEGDCGYNYYIFSREPKWGWGYGGQVFHESLVMLAYAYMDPESAINSQRVYMERQWPSGYINYRTGPYLNEQIERNGEYTSSAPWYSWQNLEIFKIAGDREFLKDAYKSGKSFYNYYTSNRDKDGDGLCEWGAHAVLECVRDARVAVWDQVGWPSNFEGPDVNAMLVSEAKALAEMAMLLGKKDESMQFADDAKKRSVLINQHLWDPQDGFYYNVNKDNQSFTFEKNNDLKIKEIIGFLPMWAGVSDSAKAAILMKSMLNEDEFWRPFGVPTLAADHPYYNPIGYWNGPVWVQWDYLLFRGLLDHGYEDEAKELAYRVLDNIAYHLKKDHVFWEFYSADNRQAGWNHTYIWAGIAARFLIDLHAISP